MINYFNPFQNSNTTLKIKTFEQKIPKSEWIFNHNLNSTVTPTVYVNINSISTELTNGVHYNLIQDNEKIARIQFVGQAIYSGVCQFKILEQQSVTSVETIENVTISDKQLILISKTNLNYCYVNMTINDINSSSSRNFNVQFIKNGTIKYNNIVHYKYYANISDIPLFEYSNINVENYCFTSNLPTSYISLPSLTGLIVKNNTIVTDSVYELKQLSNVNNIVSTLKTFVKQLTLPLEN